MNQDKDKINLAGQQGKILTALFAMRDAGMKPEIDHFMERFKRESEEKGKSLLERAHKERLISHQEWTEWVQKFDLNYLDAKSLLECYYLGKENKKDKVILLTDVGGNLWKMKSILKEKFNLETINKSEFALKIYDQASDEIKQKMLNDMHIKSREELVKQLKD